jgi:hypothetical protein
MPGSRTSRPGSSRYPSTGGRDESGCDGSRPTSASGAGALGNGPATCLVRAQIVTRVPSASMLPITSMLPVTSVLPTSAPSSARLQRACETARGGTASHGGGVEGGRQVQDDVLLPAGRQQHGMRHLRGNDANMRATILADSRAHVVGHASSRPIGNVSVLFDVDVWGFSPPRAPIVACVCVCVCSFY